jgi:DNA-directed RNA polymerase specialized sigma24 family protein
MLTPAAFEKLLASLDDDRQRAGEQYERLRVKLIRLLEWRGCATPDLVADETFDRVARRIDEGEVIRNMPAYMSRVAAYVFGEQRQRPRQVPLEGIPVAIAGFEDPREHEAQDVTDLLETEVLDRQRRCLGLLAPDDRVFIVEYHRGRGRERIERRRSLARQLGVRLNAARIRAHRIRSWLVQCTKNIDNPARIVLG